MTPGSFAIGATLSMFAMQSPAPEPRIDPRIDVVYVVNDVRTRQDVIVDQIGLRPRAVLTPDAFERAVRRLDELPSASRTSLVHVPRTHGFATVKAAVTEPSILPHRLSEWGMVGGRAVFTHDLHLSAVSPLERGEVWRLSYRWKEHRRRIGTALELPGPGWLPGIVRVEGQWEEQTYNAGLLNPSLRETRHRAGFAVSDWASGAIRWQSGAAYDRIGNAPYVSTTAGIEVRWLDDRAAMMMSTTRWTPASSAAAFSGGQAAFAWRSTVNMARPVVTARIETIAVSARAPLAVWPGAGAGGGGARDALLRAHPLFHEGILDATVLGRTLTHSTVEYLRPIRRIGASHLGVATFLDIARTWRLIDTWGAGFSPPASASPLNADLGIGLRVSSAGAADHIRLDLAYGARDHRYHLSAGFLSAWPR